MFIKSDGKEFLFKDSMPEKYWSKKDLYSSIMSHTVTDKEGKTFNPERYSIFYITIIGYFPDTLVSEWHSCESCPKNPKYMRYNRYNELMDIKIPVLVLKSKYRDFRNFDIAASFYSNPEYLESQYNFQDDTNFLEKTYYCFTADKRGLFGRIFHSIYKLFL